MKFEFKMSGLEFIFDEDDLLNTEAIAIEASAGLTYFQFLRGLRSGSVTALTAAWWICRRRQDKSLRFDQMEFPLIDFISDVYLESEEESGDADDGDDEEDEDDGPKATPTPETSAVPSG